MFVKPSKNSPAAIRKARWEAEQKKRNDERRTLVINSIIAGKIPPQA